MKVRGANWIQTIGKCRYQHDICPDPSFYLSEREALISRFVSENARN
jgi:hypothetical protein